MDKIRILIVDTTALERHMVTEALAGDPALEVVGTAANVRIALAKICSVNPDVVVSKAGMPGANGASALHALHSAHPQLPIIEFACPSGCADSQNTPYGGGSADRILQELRARLVPPIKRACEKQRNGALPGGTERYPPGIGERPAAPGPQGRRRIEIVAIGASTGGPRALSSLLSALPAGFPVPLVIVQHMLPTFTGYLTDQLSSQSSVPVLEGSADRIVQPGSAWIAPGDQHMELVRHELGVRIRLHKGPSEHSCRPAVDVLFRSVAAVYGTAALAVVLTGMGQDGLRGCKSIRAAGGQVLVQDEASSVVWGMPGAVARAGLADEVLPLDRLAAEIERRVMKERRLPVHA